MNKPIKYVTNPELMRMPIKDNGEPLVCVKDFIPQIVITIPEYIKKEGSVFTDQASKVRVNVAQRLKAAQEMLPGGYRMRLNCGYRSVAMQKKAYDEKFEELAKAHPDWNQAEIQEETNKRVAPLEIVPPHTTGGAVDVSITDESGNELDMGTKIGEDEDIEKIRTDSTEISGQSLQNRQLLIKVMTAAGFVNYAVEWWHWSYGDRYWAVSLDKDYAIYNSIALN